MSVLQNRLSFLSKGRKKELIRQIEASGLFDLAYYSSQVPDCGSFSEAVVHYLEVGYKEGFDPSIDFSSLYYQQKYPDTAELNPLVHFINWGRDEGRRTKEEVVAHRLMSSTLFDLEYYSKTVGMSFSGKKGAVRHYLETEQRSRKVPSVLFDADFYLKKYADISASEIDPYLHFVMMGCKEQRDPHPLFRTEYYKRQLENPQIDEPFLHFLADPESANPIPLFDVRFYKKHCMEIDEETNPLAHYLSNGGGLNFPTHPLFDTEYFVKNHDAPSGISLLVFILTHRSKHLFKLNNLFDPAFYVARYNDFDLGEIDPLSHYITEGSGSNYWPNPLFWPEYYSAQFDPAEIEGITTLEHYITSGEPAYFSPCPWFDIRFYLDTYSPVPNFGGALGHYIDEGWKFDYLPSKLFSPRFMRSRYGLRNAVNPLSNAIHHYGERPFLPAKSWSDGVPEYEQLNVVRKFYKNRVESPSVSILVPVFNEFSYTLRCLYSMAISGDETPFEVIVADDGSTDETNNVFCNLSGIQYIKNHENLGFLRSCNNASKEARGEFIFFLNNDTAVLPNFLDALVSTIRSEPLAGCVGSKLLYPNGLLQEAGGVIWSEGAANVGKFDDAEKPEYSYLREVDYISGAAILVRKKTWHSVGGFDDAYAPAYCEDSDFCLNLRRLGLKTLMQPESKVVHFEGISNGVDLNSGVKKYQVRNSEKLRRKWAHLLKTNGEDGDLSRSAIDRSIKPRILIIDAETPTPDQDAGSVTACYFMDIIRDLGYQITFVPSNLLNVSLYTNRLQRQGIECIYSPYYETVEQFLQENACDFEVALIYRVNEGGEFYETIRKYAPDVKIIFDTVDLHYLRLERQANLASEEDREEMRQLAQAIKQRELFLMRHADETIVLSEFESTMLDKEEGIRGITTIPIVLETIDEISPFKARQHIAFIGGFQHTPNLDAVEYFIDKLWQPIKKALPGIKFYIVGSKPTTYLYSLAEDDADIIVTGYLESLEPLMSEIKLTVAPLRFGAGIKGKIGSSLSLGVPCVATDIAGEGMGLEDGKNILLASDDETFVASVVRCYKNEKQWQLLSKGGLSFVEENYSIESTSRKLIALLNSCHAQPFSGIDPFSGKQSDFRMTASAPTKSLMNSEGRTSIADRVVLRKLMTTVEEITGFKSKSFKELLVLLRENRINVNVSNHNTFSTKSWNEFDKINVPKHEIDILALNYGSLQSIEKLVSLDVIPSRHLITFISLESNDTQELLDLLSAVNSLSTRNQSVEIETSSNTLEGIRVLIYRSAQVAISE
jgi:GT2 family glycosyltransferase